MNLNRITRLDSPLEPRTLTRRTDHLPIPSAVVRRILQILRDPDASAQHIAEALRTDPSVTGKVLRLANSAYIGIPRTVSSVQHAVVLLGVKRIHSLVITSELLAPVSAAANFPFSIDRFRQHAVTVAFIAESIARHLQRTVSIDEHELFSGAILHDIGKLVAASVDPDAVREHHDRGVELEIPYYRTEDDTFSHVVMGTALAEKWEFPESLVACIRGHHAAACFPEFHRSVSIVHIADVMAHLIGFPIYPDETTPAIDDAALAAVDLPVERLRVIAEDILKMQDQIKSLLEII